MVLLRRLDWRRRLARPSGVAAALVSAAAPACAGGDDDGSTAFADLRADVNRSGRLELAQDDEDREEDGWDARHGAIFLANLDDDERRCPWVPGTSDVDLPTCNDAADEAVNGPDDLLDLAPLHVRSWPDAPIDARATVSADEGSAQRVRFFRGVAGELLPFGPEEALDANALRQGVDLFLEGRDIARDAEAWSGFVDLTLTVTAAGFETGEDHVRLRVAPVLTHHHLEPVLSVQAAGLSLPGTVAYRQDLRLAMQRAGIASELVEVEPRGNDQWSQDHWEAGYASAPGPDGPQLMTVLLRSPHVDFFDDPLSPLRLAGRAVFEDFGGPDVAPIQEFEPGGVEELQTYNSLGNLETVPPFSRDGMQFPAGRMIIGSTPERHPDVRFVKLLEAQSVQPLIEIDTSWLMVGHIDEVVSFIPAPTPLGFKLVLGDAALGRRILEELRSAGHGDAVMFEGKEWVDLDDLSPYPAATTVQAVLEDPEIMAASARAVVETDALLETLQREIGISEQDVVRVPALHFRAEGWSVAYLPSVVNLTLLSSSVVAVARQHGPVVDGVDVLEQRVRQIFAEVGYEVAFVETWDAFHRLNGDVHCGSNVLRAASGARWWEDGS